MTSKTSPKRGEIWLVDFNPTRGAEIQKQRPALVISSDALGILPLKIVIPLTAWKPAFTNNIWHEPLSPTPDNGLSKESAVDVLQIRSVDKSRFLKKLGRIKETELENILHALAAVVEMSWPKLPTQ